MGIMVRSSSVDLCRYINHLRNSLISTNAVITVAPSQSRTVIPVIMFFIFGEQPVAMVTWGGLSQAWTLPVISFGTVYLIQRYLPKELNAPAWMTVLLWLGATVITAFVLISEFRRWLM